MNDTAIRALGLAKEYKIGEAQHNTLRDQIMAGARSLLRRGIKRQRHDRFWALRDVSFEVKKGEMVGIIGHNGAGKSTLLKILSRITEPTLGRAEIQGRVGSLLEVGTGFHFELTGRENVYLYGAILGMSKAEIDSKFKKIVEFSEIEQFLDTAVKHYSSGMYVRLAFAVAAHLDPEILLIDEVLSVGDLAFQRKCMGKLGDAAKSGRTVLFVSHNIGVVQALCSRAILLQNGSVFMDGTAAETVGAYLRKLEGFAGQELASRTDRTGKGLIRIMEVQIAIDSHSPPSILSTGRPARFVFAVDSPRPGMSCSFTIYDQFGQAVTFFDSALPGKDDVSGAPFL